MHKKILTLVALLAFVVVIYAVTWAQAYSRSEHFFAQAEENHAKGKLMESLKGERVLRADQSGYMYVGGYQQAQEVWQDAYAWPKPDVYERARTAADTLIAEEMTIDMGISAFRTYFGMNNAYLGQILLQVGDMLLEEDDSASAEEMYQTALEAFPLNETIVNTATEKIEALSEK